jgi:hypothetical protein
MKIRGNKMRGGDRKADKRSPLTIHLRITQSRAIQELNSLARTRQDRVGHQIQRAIRNNQIIQTHSIQEVKLMESHTPNPSMAQKQKIRTTTHLIHKISYLKENKRKMILWRAMLSKQMIAT